MPSVGSLLGGVGIRISGEVLSASPDATEGIVEIAAEHPHEFIYRLTGLAGEPRDYYAVFGAGEERVGAEFVLTVGSDRFHVQFDGTTDDVVAGSLVTVTGRLAIIGAYEWDTFGLSNSRADWLVKAVTKADRGDTMLNVVSPHTALA